MLENSQHEYIFALNQVLLNCDLDMDKNNAINKQKSIFVDMLKLMMQEKDF